MEKIGPNENPLPIGNAGYPFQRERYINLQLTADECLGGSTFLW